MPLQAQIRHYQPCQHLPLALQAAKLVFRVHLLPVYMARRSQIKLKARAIASGIPQKTKMQTNRTVRVWEQWAKSRNSRLLPGEKPFSAEFGLLTRSEMQFWLCRFVLETWKANGEPYNPNTLYQICCGLLRHLRINCNRSNVNFLDDREFQQFQSTLDAKMKHLNATGTTLQSGRPRSSQLLTRITYGI